jgi:ubiquinone/menaquinone biosynthesis C-methylase UbiE
MDLMLPFALLVGFVDLLGVESVLDVGSGAGRALRTLRQMRPNLRMVGIDPSEDLRRMGYRAGLAEDQLIDGDATDMKFESDSFDLVCEFGSLHHMRNPSEAVAEMCRVAAKAVLISDVNNFGEGGAMIRMAKQAINAVGLWNWADLIKTRGKRYRDSPGDGISYSYSVFNDIALLEQRCRSVHTFNIDGSGRSPYRTASHVAVIGILTDEVAGVGDRT